LAFTTLALHSAGDFGLHIPAIALLATVIAAHLDALGSPGGTVPDSKPAASPGRFRWQRLVAVLGGAGCAVTALALVDAGWRAHKTNSLVRQAFRLNETADPDSQVRRVAYLAEAVRRAPDSAEVRLQLATAQADLFRSELEVPRLQAQFRDAATCVLAWPSAATPCGGVHPALAAGPTLVLGTEASREWTKGHEESLARRHLGPILRNCLQARDLCPVLLGPQLGLARFADQAPGWERSEVYLARAERLAPASPTFWYLRGLQHLRDQQPERAWASWRHCLELSDRYLPEVVLQGSKGLSPDGLVRQVLPGQPERLLAASQLDRWSSSEEDRAPFLRRALQLLDERPGPEKTSELHTRARVQQALGQADEALGSYRRLLAREPLHAGWRQEYARLLYQEGRLREARTELLTILAQDPRHAAARQLYTIVTRELTRQN
jgi:tetratricopeptide (TPR) repeat protein